MAKRKEPITEKPCKVCSVVFPLEKLSNKGYCYECGKRRMLLAYDYNWACKGA